MPREIDLWRAYAEDQDRADARIWGRRADPLTRRGFLEGAGLATLTAALGAPLALARHYPAGLVPAAFAADDAPDAFEGKDGLRVLNRRPANAETPATALDDAVTPTARHFVRNNGLLPDRALGDLSSWSLTVDGEVDTPLRLDLDDLRGRFETVEAQLVLECGGNGRAGFHPGATGNQWTLGAVGCARYRGVRLADVLAAAGVRPSAVYVAYEGDDRHLSGDATKRPISRGVPVAKALDPHTLLAFEMNGAPLPMAHGHPLRLVVPGFPASASGKWLTRLWVRDQVHDGVKMGGLSYRVPTHPVAPGTDVDPADTRIIETMPVKSLITSPATGITLAAGEPLEVRGQAWSGAGDVTAVDVSTDFGMTWQRARLADPPNPWAWQRWSTRIALSGVGHHEVWARATDGTGRAQPMVVPFWNPKGYLNNAMHRIAVRVG